MASLNHACRKYLSSEFCAEDSEQVRAILEKLINHPPYDFKSAAEWYGLFHEVSLAISEVHTRLEVATQQDSRSKEAEKRLKNFEEHVLSQVLQARNAVTQIYLESPWRGSMHADDRGRIFREFSLRIQYTKPEIVELQIEENQIVREYRKTIALAHTWFIDKYVPVSMITGKLQDKDSEIRREAFLAYWGFIYENEEVFQDIFTRLLKNRQAQAERLGIANYIPLAFSELGRLDYTPADCQSFCESIQKVVTPALHTFVPYQLQSLKKTSIRPWDGGICPLFMPTHPPCGGNFESVLVGIGDILERIHPAFAALYHDMRRNKMLDVEPQAHKAPGAFCVTFPESGTPYIFGNFSASFKDVLTLIHEFGHAIHGFASGFIPNILLRSPGLEFCEVASMSLEMFASYFFDRLWDDVSEQKKAKGYQLFNMLVFWPFVAMMDLWQHYVYATNASPAERNQKWKELSRAFRPEIDWSGFEYLEGLGWMSRSHVFTSPFYYIDYGIAQLGAAQLWLQSRENFHETVLRYIYALSLGAQRSLPELFEAAGIVLDFTDVTLRRVVEDIKTALIELLA